ncbi:hypothetical protein Tco_1133435 [Tanacetum coccineum]
MNETFSCMKKWKGAFFFLIREKPIPDAMCWRHHDSDISDPAPKDGLDEADVIALTHRSGCHEEMRKQSTAKRKAEKNGESEGLREIICGVLGNRDGNFDDDVDEELDIGGPGGRVSDTSEWVVIETELIPTAATRSDNRKSIAQFGADGGWSSYHPSLFIPTWGIHQRSRVTTPEECLVAHALCQFDALFIHPSCPSLRVLETTRSQCPMFLRVPCCLVGRKAEKNSLMATLMPATNPQMIKEFEQQLKSAFSRSDSSACEGLETHKLDGARLLFKTYPENVDHISLNLLRRYQCKLLLTNLHHTAPPTLTRMLQAICFPEVLAFCPKLVRADRAEWLAGTSSKPPPIIADTSLLRDLVIDSLPSHSKISYHRVGSLSSRRRLLFCHNVADMFCHEGIFPLLLYFNCELGVAVVYMPVRTYP